MILEGGVCIARRYGLELEPAVDGDPFAAHNKNKQIPIKIQNNLLWGVLASPEPRGVQHSVIVLFFNPRNMHTYVIG